MLGAGETGWPFSPDPNTPADRDGSKQEQVGRSAGRRSVLLQQERRFPQDPADGDSAGVVFSSLLLEHVGYCKG